MNHKFTPQQIVAILFVITTLGMAKTLEGIQGGLRKLIPSKKERH